MKQKIQAMDVAPGDVTSYGLVVATQVEDGDQVTIISQHQDTRSSTTVPATTMVTVW